MENVPDTQKLIESISEVSALEFKNEGGFKAVYTATIGEKKEALKLVYLPPKSDTEDKRSQLIARLKRESNVLKLCSNPHLVKLGALLPREIQIGECNYIFYSEELLPGRDLKSVINDGKKADIAELLQLALTCLSVIRDLWGMGYVHRDIKPANIICTDDPERLFVLLDLGIAFKIHGTQLTDHGQTIGTRLYMPPELFSPDYKKLIDFRSDIYSLGVTLFEYATGIHPLVPRPQNDFSTVYQIITKQPDKLENLRDDLPLQFCRFVDRCMRKKPALRYAEVDEIINQLEEML